MCLLWCINHHTLLFPYKRNSKHFFEKYKCSCWALTLTSHFTTDLHQANQQRGMISYYWDCWGRYHGGRRPSSDDSCHSPTVIPPSALDKPSIMKRYHRRRTTRWGVTARSPTMVTLHDIRFVECRWWNDGWTVKTVVTWRSSASMIPTPGRGCALGIVMCA